MNGSKRRVIVISIALLALAVIGFAAAVARQRIEVSRARAGIVEQKRLLALYKCQLCTRCDSRDNYKTFSLKLGGTLPECSWSDQMPFMVSQVEGIAALRDLKIETLQPQPMSTSKNVLRFPMRIGLQADLATLTKLLEDFEKTYPLLEVDRLDMRNAQGQAGKLQVDITLSSFVVLDKNAPIVKRRVIRAVNAAPDEPVNAAMAPQAKPAPAPAQPPTGPPVKAVTKNGIVPTSQGAPPARLVTNGGKK